MRYAVLYSPTSVQRIMDFIKTIYAYGETIPVIVKPIGAAAQIGVPEAYRYSYRIGKPLLIFPELSDLASVMGLSKIYYIDPSGEERDINDVKNMDNYAIVFGSEEGGLSKKELSLLNLVWFKNIPRNLPPSALAALILYLLSH